MWRNRIIYCILFILILVLASNYGGNIVYSLLYTVVLLPVFSILYTWLVFKRFLVYQDIPTRITEKNSVVPYSLMLENRDYFSYHNIRFVCNGSLASLPNELKMGTIHMNPKMSEAIKGEVRCLYRGTYYVGIEGIEITDFFGLCRITYDFPSKIRMTVLPRVLSMEELKITEDAEDAKKNFYTTQLDNVLGNDMRGYQNGDSVRHINWKVSARYHELYVRKPDVKELDETVLFVDTFCYWETENERIIHSDAIVETAIAIAKHYSDRGLQLTVVYHNKRDIVMPMTNVKQFQSFYQEMSVIDFSEKYGIEKVVQTYYSGKGELQVILVMYQVTNAFAERIKQMINRGQHVTVFLAGTENQNVALPKECMVHRIVSN